MVTFFIKNIILRQFYKIKLSRFERDVADTAVSKKYAPGTRNTLLYSSLLTPPLFFLDTSVVVTALIPVTMVAGTAWFAVSLASMKKKFENFGMKLTKALFEAFSLSLAMLMLATAVSLSTPLWEPCVQGFKGDIRVIAVSVILAVLVVGRLLFAVFAGSVMYDVNDAMLSGQNEVAEQFFKQSLSLLHKTVQHLRSGMPLQVANYYLGLCFREIAQEIDRLRGAGSKFADELINDANLLIKFPSISQKDADGIAIRLIETFLVLCKDAYGHRSYQSAKIELRCLKENTEPQMLTDIRISVILVDIATLIEDYGANLFVSPSEALE